PTASCLPEPLFDRGVTMLCGCQVIDCERFVELWSNGQRWRDSTRRYLLRSG
ncbi:Rossmann-like domain-containing protein, partial [Pseudomonadota bacterium]